MPSDIIKRAIDKVNSGADESYENVMYELFGPAGSTLIVDCLTDNLNRSVSSVRAVINKCHIKMGSMGSVSYMYDNVCVVSVKGLTEEETLDAMIENDIDVSDVEKDDDLIYVYGNPKDLYDIKKAIESKLPNVEFETDDIVWIAKDKINLDGENLELFNKLVGMLDEIEDVSRVYHNVEL